MNSVLHNSIMCVSFYNYLSTVWFKCRRSHFAVGCYKVHNTFSSGRKNTGCSRSILHVCCTMPLLNKRLVNRLICHHSENVDQILLTLHREVVGYVKSREMVTSRNVSFMASARLSRNISSGMSQFLSCCIR